jgi:NB-ARC domain
MPVKTFVQRTTLREQIHEQLNRSLCEEMEGETRKVGVWGLGGAGKSQLARSYLRRYRADYNATFWIEAGQTTSIDRDFLQIYHSFASAPLQNNSLSAENILRAVHSWFIGRRGRWLFVFDGADQLENESDLHFVNISQYIPGSPNVHVIITSRSSKAKTLSTFEGVKVGELEGPQAVELFFKCSEITKTQQKVVDEVKLIVKELGYLALAITLAGSYISQTPRLSSNLPVFLEDYYRRRQEILSEQPNKLIHQYGESVMTVWEMSYLAVENQLPEAGRFLTLLAFLNYEDIFLDLFGLDTNAASPPTQRSWRSII